MDSNSRASSIVVNKNHIRWIGTLLGPLAFGVIYFLLPIEGLSIEGKGILASVTWMAIWWLSEAVSIETTALLPIVLFPTTQSLDLKSTTLPYAHPLIFLFLGGFIIALAIEKWNLHKRIALSIVALIGTNPKKIILGFMVATGFLSMWISNTATTLMMLPIGTSLIQHVDEKDKFSKALMLSIAYSASIGGMATLIGTPPNLIFTGIVKETFNIEISFLQWSILATPFSVVMIGLTWYYITHHGFKLTDSRGNIQEEVRSKLKALGKISSDEKKVLAVFILTALAWIFRTFFINKWLPGVSDTVIGITGGIALFLIPSSIKDTKLMDWDFMKKVPWGILILFGAGLSLANGFVKTDLASWVGQQLYALSGLHILILMIIVIASINFITEFTTNIATASMALPILAALAIAIGIHPYGLMVGAILASSCAFMLPVATAPNAVVFGSGFLEMKDMVKTGIWLNVISICLIVVIVYLLMPVLWDLNLQEVPSEFLHGTE